VAETLRAALKELATVAPAWLQGRAPLAWYERYAKGLEDSRLPTEPSQRDAYAQTVGEDGLQRRDALESPEALAPLRTLPWVATLHQLWQDHYERQTGPGRPEGAPSTGPGRFKEPRAVPRAAAHIESPYEVDARYRTKGSTQWPGSMVHGSATCADTTPHLLPHVQTTSAAVHEAMGTDDSHQALTEKDLAPQAHLVDAAYVDAALVGQSRQAYGIDLLGPTRDNARWQTKVDGA
jgi:transposase